ncbi:RICIN domain-containing protein, partial [Fibrella sp. WM1]|uniref:RICIN domain-containing protein n=1 Tax=Fibrella musci TaxID=3242485 RepID=UPI00352292E4
STQANPVLTFTPQTPRANTVITNFNVQLVVRDSKGLATSSQVFKVSLTAANRPPVVVATSTSLTGASPLSVTFTGSGSSDPDGDALTYEWRDADNFSTLSTQANPVLTFTPQTPRANTVITNFNVQLVVRDSKGLATSSQVFKVSLTTTPPTGVTAVDPSKCYRLVSRVSGKVMGVEGNSLTDGAQVRQRSDANQLAQRWRFESVGDGYYKIGAVHSNKALDVIWGSQDNGIGLQQWTFNGNWSYNQHFALQRNANGFFQITARHSGKALDVQNGNTDEGGLIVQYTPNGAVSQQWTLEESACTTGSSSTTTTPPVSSTGIDVAKCYRIQSRSSGLVLNVPSGLGNDGIYLRQNTNADKLWQKWRFTVVDGDYYRISVQHNQKSIQVANSSMADNAPLEQWTYWGGSHQQWKAQRTADGFYTLTNRNSGKAITVQNASTAEGGDITQQTLGTGAHQQWRLTETACPTGGRMAAAEPTAVFSLWPNPARDHVLVDLSLATGQPVGLTMTDLQGRSRQQTYLEAAPAEPYRLDLGSLPDGLYLLRVAPGQSTAGSVINPTTLRVLIQR